MQTTYLCFAENGDIGCTDHQEDCTDEEPLDHEVAAWSRILSKREENSSNREQGDKNMVFNESSQNNSSLIS